MVVVEIEGDLVVSRCSRNVLVKHFGGKKEKEKIRRRLWRWRGRGGKKRVYNLPSIVAGLNGVVDVTGLRGLSPTVLMDMSVLWRRMGGIVALALRGRVF